MKGPIIAAAVSAAVVALLGLEGCAPGTIWNQSHIFSSKGSVALAEREAMTVNQRENLTSRDREQLTSLIDRKAWIQSSTH